jgi:hypothetical protein
MKQVLKRQVNRIASNTPVISGEKTARIENSPLNNTRQRKTFKYSAEHPATANCTILNTHCVHFKIRYGILSFTLNHDTAVTYC